MATDYKTLKEAFVSNLTGSTVWEVNKVTLVAPAAILLWSTLQSRQRFFTPYTATACLADFLLNGAAILSVTTIYSSYPLILNALLCIPAILIALTSSALPAPGRSKAKPPTIANGSGSTKQHQLSALPIKPFVTHYRGTMMMVTCAAILAVDFKVFPRRFGKVENWGTSVMDMGVGSFVFSSGTVAARAVLKEGQSGRTPQLVARLRTAMRHSAPLLVLGLIRLYSVKGLDYAEHVSEYGVHWNFFFTLGMLPPFIALVQGAVSRSTYTYTGLALLIAGLYEAALDFTDLKAFMLTAPRVSLLSANREGIFSFFGYLAIFLAGQSVGFLILPREPPTSQDDPEHHRVKKTLPVQLASWAIIWNALFLLVTSYYTLNLHVSRRLANLPYVSWVCAFNCGQIFLFCTFERLLFPNVYEAPDAEIEVKRANNATSRLLHAMNRNGLALFLIANLLTGLVNMTLPTLHMGDLQAMAVLISYMATISAVALGLDHVDVSIKL